jgi:hypothetical protein
VLVVAQGMATRGHFVTVACQAGGRLEARARAAGLAVRPIAFGGDLAPRAILGLARVLGAESPHVVHAHDPHATAASLLAARSPVASMPPATACSRASGPTSTGSFPPSRSSA